MASNPLGIVGAVQNVLGGGSGGGGLFAAAGRGTLQGNPSSTGGYGLSRLLNRRRGAPAFLMKRRKPKSLEELQMMKGGGNDYEESAP